MPVTCQFYWSSILSKLIGTVSHYWCLNRISRNQKMRGEYKNLEKSVWIALGGAQYYTKTSQDYRSMIYCSHEVSIWAKSGFFGTTFSAVGRRTKEGKRFDADWRLISSAGFHKSSNNCERNTQKWNSNNKDCKKETIGTLMWPRRSCAIKLCEAECFVTTR